LIAAAWFVTFVLERAGGKQLSKTILLRRYAVVDFSIQFVPRVVVRLASSGLPVGDQGKHKAFADRQSTAGLGERLWSADRS